MMAYDSEAKLAILEGDFVVEVFAEKIHELICELQEKKASDGNNQDIMVYVVGAVNKMYIMYAKFEQIEEVIEKKASVTKSS